MCHTVSCNGPHLGPGRQWSKQCCVAACVRLRMSALAYQSAMLLTKATTTQRDLSLWHTKALHAKYAGSGLAILGFPCNQFGSQEPGTNEEIKKFAQEGFGVQFDIFDKIEVNGKNAHPLYKYLKKEQKGTFGDFIKWNFSKFLVNKEGKPVNRYAPNVEPNAIEKDFTKLL
ncbi:glutathione peroxidase [Elysia marginata]|uniref:Glutathione peroxidase n=1 Tax=Elysia marginata TaxID=1093978 RepID=A0AAV4IKM1_9GAST|nr:glutathione peroxidase [Elysia marginata]